MQKIYEILPRQLQQIISFDEWMKLCPEEVRFRIGQPIVLEAAEKEYYFEKDKPRICENSEHAILAGTAEIEEILSSISQSSLYAYQEEIRQGYLTYYGGHRVGMCGKAVLENGHLKGLSRITYLNIRIAREYPHCAGAIMPCLWEGEELMSTLIFSAPGVGKTTLLRECVRILSDGMQMRKGKKVSLIDERGEIAGCYEGVPQRKIGMRTDVLDGVHKSEGMLYMLRAMSPEVIAVDEIGAKEDFEAMDAAINCGCRIFSTIHAGSIEELLAKEQIDEWFRRQKFQRYVHIVKTEDGRRECHVYDECLQYLC